MPSAPRVPHFVLLADFWSAYDTFALKAPGLDERIDREVVEPVRRVVESHSDRYELLHQEQIDDRAAWLELEDAFVITMDGGSYFRNFQFSFEITRAAFSLIDAQRNEFFRMARENNPLFHAQTLQIREAYRQASKRSRIVLCDDGLGTGKSVRDVLISLSALSLEVSEVVVLLNPQGIPDIEGVPVTTLFPEYDTSTTWLSERDLFWGLPRSGVSFTEFDDVNTQYGMPYTIDAALTASRIGIETRIALRLRAQCLDLNARLWRLLDAFHGRVLRFEDCPRLLCVPAHLDAEASGSIADFIERINDPGYDAMTVGRVGASP